MPERMLVRELVPEHVGRSITMLRGKRASGKIRQIIFSRSYQGPHVTLVVEAKAGRSRDIPWLAPETEISLRGDGDGEV